MLKRTVIISAILLCLEWFSGISYAGRPFSTEDAGVAGKGVVQTEASIDYARQDNGDKDYTFLFVPIYGIVERLEFSVEFPYRLARPKEGDDEEGLEDINLVLKGLIIEEGDKTPAFLIKAVLKVDNGDEEKGLGSGDKDLSLVAVATKVIGPLTLHTNFGYTFVGKGYDPTLKDYIIYGLAGEYAIGEKVKVVGELYGESNSHFDVDAFKHHDLQALLGLTYQLPLPHPPLQWGGKGGVVLDAAVKIGLTDDSPDYGFAAGLSITF